MIKSTLRTTIVTVAKLKAGLKLERLCSSIKNNEFPWIDSKHRLSDIDSDHHIAVTCDKIKSFNAFCGTSLMKLDLRDEEDIVGGADDAFRSATEAIFPQDMPRNSLVNTEDAVLEHMNTIFDPKVTQYFHSILQRFREEKYAVFYTLFGITNPKLISHSFLFGASRAFTGYDGVYHDDCGAKILLSPVCNENHLKVESFNELPESQRRGMLTVRYTVEVECAEIFYVRDTEYNEIVQGSEDVQTVKHRIILENFIPYTMQIMKGWKGNKDILQFVRQAGHQPDDWKIVDVDNWLNGNMFWLNSTEESSHKTNILDGDASEFVPYHGRK